MADTTFQYAGGGEVPDFIDASTRRSSIGMDPRTGEGNGDPDAPDSSTAAGVAVEGRQKPRRGR